ncbi:MAG: hypothetical protein LC132_09430 [Burkholderiales bacterium]|jgi:hypothetical protein|nr:hypothetical protein [Burkholderiales bacterium]OQB72938.1 MAG: hypothetical protein BWX92_03509 [Deltaproteobacteria bacterium ADurb.Bin135]
MRNHQKGAPIEKESRQVRRARQRADEKEKKRIAKELKLSDFTYVADDNNMTLSAMASLDY